MTRAPEVGPIIVAARPASETSLALNFAEHAAVREERPLALQLEIARSSWCLRLLSSVANIDSQRLRTASWRRWTSRAGARHERAAEAPVYIDDTRTYSTMSCGPRPAAAGGVGLDLLIVDYLQLMQSSVQSRDANRVQEVSEISRGSRARSRSSRCR